MSSPGLVRLSLRNMSCYYRFAWGLQLLVFPRHKTKTPLVYKKPPFNGWFFIVYGDVLASLPQLSNLGFVTQAYLALIYKVDG